jgi:hypothetical protein
MQKWGTTDEPEPALTDDVDEILADVIEGVNTVRTRYSETKDPSSGASWGVDQIGTEWLDTNNELGNGGDDLGGFVKVWVKLDATPTYGWRVLYRRTYTALEPDVNVLDLSAQSTVTDTDLDLTSSTSARAVAARLLVTVKDTGTPAATVFASIRKNGTTTDARERRVYPQAAGVTISQIVEVELDSAQVMEYAIDASGAGTCDLRIDVLGYYERAT